MPRAEQFVFYQSGMLSNRLSLVTWHWQSRIASEGLCNASTLPSVRNVENFCGSARKTLPRDRFCVLLIVCASLFCLLNLQMYSELCIVRIGLSTSRRMRSWIAQSLWWRVQIPLCHAALLQCKRKFSIVFSLVLGVLSKSPPLLQDRILTEVTIFLRPKVGAHQNFSLGEGGGGGLTLRLCIIHVWF
jgi:hypothetical protein